MTYFSLLQTQYTVKFSVEVGKLLNSIQRERDMSILYLSMLGPGTKTFLINEYQLTDKALDKLSDWPANSALDSFFHTKESFKAFLNNHRSQLNLATVDIFVEMEFYNKLIERFMHWMYGAIRESKKTSIWKILVSYQKIVTGMEQLGIERALGVIYYVKGGFRTNKLYEEYNNNVNTFKANYRSAVLYSKEIDPIFQKAVTSSGKNLTTIIETYRYEIQHNLAVEPSIAKTQWWFDNMTLYLDVILVIYICCIVVLVVLSTAMCSSVAELMVRCVVGLLPCGGGGGGSSSLFLFQPVLNNWYNIGRTILSVEWGMQLEVIAHVVDAAGFFSR